MKESFGGGFVCGRCGVGGLRRRLRHTLQLGQKCCLLAGDHLAGHPLADALFCTVPRVNGSPRRNGQDALPPAELKRCAALLSPPLPDPLFGCALLELMAAHGAVAKAFGTDFNAPSRRASSDWPMAWSNMCSLRATMNGDAAFSAAVAAVGEHHAFRSDSLAFAQSAHHRTFRSDSSPSGLRALRTRTRTLAGSFLGAFRPQFSH